jgi:hypothetical protein
MYNDAVRYRDRGSPITLNAYFPTLAIQFRVVQAACSVLMP